MPLYRMTNSILWLLNCGYYFLYFPCFHIQKQLIFHALAINIQVLTKMLLGMLNMRHLIVGQVGIKIITSITGGKESNALQRICLNQDGRTFSANKISLPNLPIFLLTLSML